jgi:hypothetical protein
MKLSEQQEQEKKTLEKILDTLYPEARMKFIQDAKKISPAVKLVFYELAGDYKSAEKYAEEKGMKEEKEMYKFLQGYF